MKTNKSFLCLTGIFLVIMFSSAAFALDDNILRQGLAGEITVEPANDKNGNENMTSGAVVSGDNILANNVSGEIEVSKPTLPEKGQWMRLGNESHNDTISEVAWPFCMKKNRASLEKILQINSLTWESAKRLKPGFEFFVPAQLLKDEGRFPLEKMGEMRDKVEEAHNEVSEALIALDNRDDAIGGLKNDLGRAEEVINDQKTRINDLLDERKALSKTNVELSEENEKISENLDESLIWLIVAVGGVILLAIAFMIAMFKLVAVVKTNNQLRSLLAAGRINVRFDSDDLSGAYAFYCKAYYKNGQLDKYDIAPLIWGGESVLNKDQAKEAVQSLLKKHLRGEEVPEVAAALKSGQLIQLETAEEPEVIEPEIVDESDDDSQQAQAVAGSPAGASA